MEALLQSVAQYYKNRNIIWTLGWYSLEYCPIFAYNKERFLTFDTCIIKYFVFHRRI